MNKFPKILFPCLLASALITACGDSSSKSEDSEVVSISKKNVSGFSQKGPFVKGASVHLYELDFETLTQTGNSFLGKIKSDQGDFVIENINLNSSFALLEATGYFKNEVTGKKSTSTITLNAVSNLQDRESVNINILTHLEFERVNYLIKKGSSIADAKAQAEAEILKSFGAKENGKFFEELDLFGSADESAILLAISILMINNQSEADLTDFFTEYSSDIEKDGTWDNKKRKEELASWALDQIATDNFASIRKNVESLNTGKAPDFETHIKNFIDMVFPCNSKTVGDTLHSESGRLFACKKEESGNYSWQASEGFLSQNHSWTYKDGAKFNFSNGDFHSAAWWDMYASEDSKIEWPAKLGKGNNAFQAIIDTCKGICGQATKGEYLGFTLNFTAKGVGESTESTDISAWGGLCVESEGDLNIEIIPKDQENETEYGNFYYNVTKAGIIDIPWEYFIQPVWGKPSVLERNLKAAVGIKFRIENNGKFKLKAIGPMGTCGKATVKPVEQNEYGGGEYDCETYGTCYIESENECNSANDGIKGINEYGDYVVCQNGEWVLGCRVDGDCGETGVNCKETDVCNEYGEKIECDKSNEGEAIPANIGGYNICSSGKWVYLSSEDYENWTADIDGRVCSKDFDQIKGAEDGSNIYTCYKGFWYDSKIFPWTKERDAYLNSSITYKTLKDTRDGQSYATIDIGPYTWMAQNLNYADTATMTNLKENIQCYYGYDINCDFGGRLYSWTAAMNIDPKYKEKSAVNIITEKNQGVCPDGWWLPDTTEYAYLYKVTGESIDDLRSKGVESWKSFATDKYGFSLINSGWAPNWGTIDDQWPTLWFASENPESPKKEAMGLNASDWWTRVSGNEKGNYYSVRCITYNTPCTSSNDGAKINDPKMDFVCKNGTWKAAVPTNVTGLTVEGDRFVSIKWTAPESNKNIVKFKLYYKTEIMEDFAEAGQWTAEPENHEIFTDTQDFVNLSEIQKITFAVIPVNLEGFGPDLSGAEKVEFTVPKD